MPLNNTTAGVQYPSNRGVTVRNTPRAMSAIYAQTLTNPVAASTTAYLVSTPGPNTATILITRTGALAQGNVVFNGARANGAPDFPRNVVITVTHASAVVAVSGVITGVDVYNKILTEAWSVTAGTTSKTFTGAKSFARVDSVTVTAVADATADTVSIGLGQVFGADVTVSVASALKEVSGGSVVTTGTFVVGSGTPAGAPDQRGTYSPAAAPNGATTYQFWIISDLPEASSN